jgi:hypothetical protein
VAASTANEHRPHDGLVVIGVHTPEFRFEGEIDRVRSTCDHTLATATS